MPTTQFPLSTVITVQVSTPAPGFAGYNSGNLALFTDDLPGNSFPANGIQYYQTAAEVAADFGTASKTYQMANAVFSQAPNILLPGGQLIIIKMLPQKQHLVLSAVPASGAFEIQSSNGTTAPINWNDTTIAIQAKVQAVPGQSQWQVSGSLASQSLVIECDGSYGTQGAVNVVSNTLQDAGSNPITFTITQTQQGESVGATLARTLTLATYAGVVVNELYETIGSSDFTGAAAAFQAQNIMWGVVGTSDTENQSPSGVFYQNTQAGNSNTRCISYLDTTPNNALLYLAGYMSRLMSVDYTGVNTTITMNGKQIAGVPPDSVITTGAEFNHAKLAGSDIYISIQGVPFTISNGANEFADQVSNRHALANDIQTAYFNVLATTSTKVAQTLEGQNKIKSAIKQVLAQYVTNGEIAPGTWTSPDTFGNQDDFLANISQFGYYVFMTPPGQQSQTNRAQRIAPLMQIAVKEAGAIHSGNVVILVNP